MKRYNDWLYKKGVRNGLRPEDAEDVAQGAYFKKNDIRFAVIDYYRTFNSDPLRKYKSAQDSDVVCKYTPEDYVIEKEDLDRKLKLLSPMQRFVVAGIIYGYTQKELAKMIGREQSAMSFQFTAAIKILEGNQ